MLYILNLYAKYILIPIFYKAEHSQISLARWKFKRKKMTAAWVHLVSKPNQESQSHFIFKLYPDQT